MIRPDSFAQFSGQSAVVEPLTQTITAAKHRGESCPHILLTGGPGLGKTTLAQCVAAEMGGRLTPLKGEALASPSDLAGILIGQPAGGIVFIDEVHLVSPKAQSTLLSALEDGKVSMVLEKGLDARAETFTLPPLTFIGATTDPHRLSGPMRDRFPVNLELRPYPAEDMALVVAWAANELGLALNNDAIAVLVERSRGIPRQAHRLVGALRDYITTRGLGEAGRGEAAEACCIAGVGPMGLSTRDLQVLVVLAKTDRPIGIRELSNRVGERQPVIEEVHEPFLTYLDMMKIEPTGRAITPAGREYVYRYAEV